MGGIRGGVPPVRVPLPARPDGGTQGGVPPIGVPPLSWYPPARSDGGYLRWGMPLAGPGWGTPLARSNRGEGWYPRWGTLPQLDLAGVTPPPHLDLAGVNPLPWVWTDRWTDTSQNITFPSYYVRGR